MKEFGKFLTRAKNDIIYLEIFPLNTIFYILLWLQFSAQIIIITMVLLSIPLIFGES